MARAKYGSDDAAPKPRSDVYVGLLAISLAGLLVSCLLLFLDYHSYGDQRPSPPPLQKLPEKKVDAPPKE